MIPRHLIIGIAILLAVALGISVYAWRMRKHVKETEAATAYSQPMTPPVAGPTEAVTLWVAYDDPGILRAQSARIPLPNGRQERAQELLRALIGIYLDKNSPHLLAPGSDVRDVYLVDPGLAVIDVNAAFADGHRSGVLVEELTITSLAQTLAVNVPGINRIRILVDGKTRDTLAGHADLSDAYEVSAIAQLATTLQSVQ